MRDTEKQVLGNLLKSFLNDTNRYGYYLIIKTLLYQTYITGISTDSGLAFSESKSINLSLSTLGKVIQCLSSDKPAHIPYRESKLTRILQV